NDRRSALARLFGPAMRALAEGVGRLTASGGDDRIARLLRQAGRRELTPDDYFARQFRDGLAGAGLGAPAVAIALHAPAGAVVGAAAGVVAGLTRTRRRLDREVAARAERIRLELYTVNHLLAMHVRTGAGPIQAVQRLVERGRGAAIGELRDVLVWMRSGMSEAEAFRHAAELTPEQSAARTHQLLAAGLGRSVDRAGRLP